MSAHALLAVATLLLSGHPALAIPEGPAAGHAGVDAARGRRTTPAPPRRRPSSSRTRISSCVWQTQAQANQDEWLARSLADPSWIGPPSGNTMRDAAQRDVGLRRGRRSRRAIPSRPGRTGRASTRTRPRSCRSSSTTTAARGSRDACGRRAAGSPATRRSPASSIENGSIQATEPLYWWFAQALVRAGYVVLTFDPRGQGRSDFQTPTRRAGQQHQLRGLLQRAGERDRLLPLDARRTPYPHNVTCAATYPTAVAAFNPFCDRIDPGAARHRRPLARRRRRLGGAGLSRRPLRVPRRGRRQPRRRRPRVGQPRPQRGRAAARARRWDTRSEYGIGGVAFTTPPDPEERQDRLRRRTRPPACRSTS